MPSRKKTSPPTDPDPTAWRIILEDMRSNFRAAGEQLDVGLRGLNDKLEEFRREVNQRFEILEAVVRENSVDIRQNSADIRQNTVDIRQNSADIVALTNRVEKLERLDERVATLESSRR